MKLKQQVELTSDEAVKILSKVVESKTKKKVVKAAETGGIFTFELEDSAVEEPQK
jgi:hypothetical protein